MMKRTFVFLALLVGISAFAQQPDLSLVPYRQGNKWGYASPDKQIVIKPQFDDAHWFFSGFAAVKKGTKYGYINTSGKLLIPYKFTVAKPFRYGYVSKGVKQKEDTVLFAGASLQATGYEICIDTKGNRMAKCPAINENTDPANRQPPVIVQEKSYSLSNDSLFDKIVDDYKLSTNGATYYIAVKNNQYGVFNNTFETVVPFQYASIKKMVVKDGIYLQVQKESRNGLLKGDGAVFIPAEQTKLLHVKGSDGNDYFIAAKDGTAALTNVESKSLLTSDYSDIAYDDQGGFVLTGKDNRQGFYFLTGQSIEPKYQSAKLVAGGKYLLVKTASGKTGYVNMSGDEFFTY